MICFSFIGLFGRAQRPSPTINNYFLLQHIAPTISHLRIMPPLCKGRWVATATRWGCHKCRTQYPQLFVIHLSVFSGGHRDPPLQFVVHLCLITEDSVQFDLRFVFGRFVNRPYNVTSTLLIKAKYYISKSSSLMKAVSFLLIVISFSPLWSSIVT